MIHPVCAAQYGKQFVPVSSADEGYMAHKPERGIQLMGFWDPDIVPLHQHMKVSSARRPHVHIYCMP